MRQIAKKVCLLGDFAVGKTSLVRRFVEGCFDERYLSTIGVKVDRKLLQLPAPGGDVILSSMVWDLAGGPEAGAATPSYFRGAAGAVIACDLTRPETLPGVSRYADRFLAVNPGARLVIAANKVDLDAQLQLTEEQVVATAAALGAAHFLTSAKTGEQVEAIFWQLGWLLL
jgi:GTPase SAR1 family protein